MEKDITRINYDDIKMFIDEVVGQLENNEKYKKLLNERNKLLEYGKKLQDRMIDIGIVTPATSNSKSGVEYTFITYDQLEFMRNTVAIAERELDKKEISEDERKKFEVIKVRLYEQIELANEVFDKNSKYYFHKTYGLVDVKYVSLGCDLHKIMLETVYNVYKKYIASRPLFKDTVKLFVNVDRDTDEYISLASNYSFDDLSKVESNLAMVLKIEEDNTLSIDSVCNTQMEMIFGVLKNENVDKSN